MICELGGHTHLAGVEAEQNTLRTGQCELTACSIQNLHMYIVAGMG